jgi:hypothetical protein
MTTTGHGSPTRRRRFQPADRLDVELPPRPEAGRIAREAVDTLSEKLHPETFAKVRLLVTELVIAALPDREQDGPVRLEVELVDGRVRAEVSRGGGDDSLRPRRWGLFLVQRLADDWEVSTERQSVRFEVLARPLARREAASA